MKSELEPTQSDCLYSLSLLLVYPQVLSKQLTTYTGNFTGYMRAWFLPIAMKIPQAVCKYHLHFNMKLNNFNARLDRTKSQTDSERERESVRKRGHNGILLTWNCLWIRLKQFAASCIVAPANCLCGSWPKCSNARDASESRSQLMQIKWIMIFVCYLWMSQLRVEIFPQLIIQIGK